MPSPSTDAPASRLLLALVALVGVAVAACSPLVDRARGAGPATTTSRGTTSSTAGTTTATTTTAVSRPMPANTAGGVVDLVAQPCAALSQEQAAALGARTAGEPIQLSEDLSCKWVTDTAIFAFVPHPDADMTADPAMQNRTSPTRISGHPARTGIQGADAANCLILVSVGGGQSFELMFIPTGAGARGDALCDGFGVNVATAVLTHLP